MGLTACEDVPAPYGVNWDGESSTVNTNGKALPYASASLNDFSTLAATLASGEANNPWSTGSSYTQATGYQKWSGDSKSNKEAEGYLISPAFDTKCESGNVKISFDNCVGYANNDSKYAEHVKLYVSKGATEGEWKADEWKQLDWKATHVSTDWTLTTDEVTLPNEYANETNVRIAFWFYAPASGSATFELKNFRIQDASGSIDETPGDDPTPTPVPGENGSGTKEDPFTATGISQFAASLAADQNSADSYYFKGYVTEIKEAPGNTYGNATFYIGNEKGGANAFYVFRCMYYGGSKFTSADQLKVGDEVVIYGPVVNYKGNTPETVGNKASIVSINGVTESTGGEEDSTPDPTPSGSTDGVSIAGNVVTLTNSAATAGTDTETIDLNTLGYENQQDVTTVKGTGCTLTFAAGTNSNAPKFYSATKGVRVYANNTITFASTTKAIAKVEMTCDEYNGVTYVGNDTATLAADGNSLIYTNASSTAGTQLRVQTIKVTYAK